MAIVPFLLYHPSWADVYRSTRVSVPESYCCAIRNIAGASDCLNSYWLFLLGYMSFFYFSNEEVDIINNTI